ncbi:Putative beta-barrel porin-2, OmpL-like. bbp2 [Cyclobacterium xiamenense]|uniref:Putative beta-barrel porin-2, OmpL-like. bbp2 n=1 Tax=Cyclobacterium xiamenense TaxID=1297121 RepID=A0A1H6YQ72_9BACT|nr:porin [Cyclobacterium xiamenense]SEJ39402.1 Putative beta-barrel porin-2, OmpL-like. bbp2 [Cyclobacterium xiamenense]
MKKFQLLIVLVILSTLTLVNAQEATEKPKVALSGSIDAYFRTNINAPNKGDEYQAPATSFANLPGFSLGMANIIASYEGEKIGFVADMVFGPRGEDAVFGSPLYSAFEGGSSQIVNQLYMYWNASDVVTFTIGDFNTYLGYEVISPTGNFNYSTSYMFSYGPFSHTGLKADFQLSDNWSLMASVMNPTDVTEFNSIGSYTFGGQLAYATDAGGTYLNLLYGDQDGKLDMNTLSSFGNASMGNTFQIDLTTGYDLTESVYAGFNATYNTTSAGQVLNGNTIQDATGDGFGFYGVAGYLQLATSEAFSLGARGEYFSVFNEGLEGVVGLNTTGDGNVVAFTLSGNAKVMDNLTLIPEVRFDSMSENFFLNNNYENASNLTSFLLAAVFSF